MEFSINARTGRISRAKHRDMDEQIQVCITGGCTEGHVDAGRTVYRRIGSMKIINTPKTYTIYGEANPETITALRKVLIKFGCKFT